MKTQKIIRIMLIISLFAIMAQSAYSQAIVAQDRWNNKKIHIGLNDANSTQTYRNWEVTFGKAPTNNPDDNLGLWCVGMYGNNFNVGRVSAGGVLNPGSKLFYLTEDWKCGIAISGGSEPAYTLDVRGEAISNRWRTRSDRRIKKDFKPIVNVIDDVNKLKSYKYRRYYKVETVEEVLKRMFNGDTSEQARAAAEAVVERQRKVAESDTAVYFGFIAQELKEVYPELVDADNEGMLNVDYVGMIPVLVEAIKELKAENAELRKLINSNKLSSSVEDAEGMNAGNKAVLYQNTPNPFTQNTEIQYYLPQNTDQAFIGVYDLTGKELNQYKLNEKGKSRILINANEFAPGMYLYSLIVDGKEVDTKKMIITK